MSHAGSTIGVRTMAFLTAPFQSLGLEREVAVGDPARQTSEQTANCPFIAQPKLRPRATGRRLHRVVREHAHQWGAAFPDEALPRVKRTNGPDRRRESRLANQCAAADAERSAAKQPNARHRGCPFVPAFDVRHDLPHRDWRCGDVDGDCEGHGEFIPCRAVYSSALIDAAIIAAPANTSNHSTICRNAAGLIPR